MSITKIGRQYDNNEYDSDDENGGSIAESIENSIARCCRARIRNEMKSLVHKEDWNGIVQMLHLCRYKDNGNDIKMNSRSGIDIDIDIAIDTRSSEATKDGPTPAGLQQSSTKRVEQEAGVGVDVDVDKGGEIIAVTAVIIEEEIVSLVSTSNNLVQLKLIKKNDDDVAQDLLVMLCTLGGKKIVSTSSSSRSINTEESSAATGGWNNSNSVTFYQGGYRYRGSLIHAAMKYHARSDVVIKFIELGGREAVLELDDDGRNSLHIACCSNSSLDVVSKIIDVGGGRDFVLEKNRNNGWTALHYACQNGASLGLVLKLIDVGGEKLVLAKDRVGKYGWTALRFACCYNASVDVVSKLIEIGGRDALLEKNEDGWNLLHFACRHRAPLAVVSKLIEVGGKKLLMGTAYNGDSVLHCAVNHVSKNIDTIELLIECGGEGILMQKTKTNVGERTPLQFLLTKNTRYFEQGQKRKIVEKASVLINRGNTLKIGGEFSIGGLFESTSNEEVLGRIYDNWDELGLPALEKVMALPQNRHLPILHAAIISEAPLRVMKTIFSRFLGCINTTDSLGRLPIDVCVQRKLSWDKGMKEVIQILSSVQQTPVIHLCARHGLQWENGMKNIFEDSTIEDKEKKDDSAGLYPFMFAAIGGKYNYDISLIFQLILASPRLVRPHKSCDYEALGKRKRLSENDK